MVIEQDDRPALVLDASPRDDASEFSEVYERWSPLVYTVALYSLGSVTDAEVVTQRVFTGAWTSLRSLDTTPARLPGWLIETTLRTIAQLRAAESNQNQLSTGINTVTRMDEKTEPADLAVRLVLADEVSRLDAIPQQVIRMALHDDLTHAQIAASLGLPSETVKSHIRHSLLKLRARLEMSTDAH